MTMKFRRTFPRDQPTPQVCSKEDLEPGRCSNAPLSNGDPEGLGWILPPSLQPLTRPVEKPPEVAASLFGKICRPKWGTLLIASGCRIAWKSLLDINTCWRSQVSWSCAALEIRFLSSTLLLLVVCEGIEVLKLKYP